MPSTRTFSGAATPIAQVNTYTFSGTWVIGDLITFTYGSASWTYTIASATIATFLAAMNTAYNALSSLAFPQFAAENISANPTGSTITLTALAAGRPFTCTISTNSAAGLINGTTSTTGTATTTSSGPNDYGVSTNWTPVGVPTTGDTVDLTNTSLDILYSLDQHTVTLANLIIDSTFTGKLGLADNNPSGYTEYRPAYLQTGATLCTIGAGSGANSERIKVDFYTIQTTCTIISTNTSVFDPDVTAPVLLKGSNSSNSLSITQGVVNSAMTLTTLNVSYHSVVSSDVILQQTGTVGTLFQTGGTINVSGNTTTCTMLAGASTLSGTATCTTLKVLTALNTPLTFYWASSGTITTGTFSAGATLNANQNLVSRTMTNCNLEAGAAITDPAITITFTNPFYLRACGVQDVTLNLGRDIHLQRS